ncbi:MAG: CHASE2 domain-containing protein [Flavobacteriales bacterium]
MAITEGLVYFSNQMSRSPLAGIENQIVDLAFQVRSENKSHQKIKPDDIVIIDIDDASIEHLGRTQLWPRAYDATVIRNVSAGKPKAIGIDFLYTESDSMSSVYRNLLSEKGFEQPTEILEALSTDIDLTRAIYRAGNVYLSLFDDGARFEEEMNLDDLNYLRIIQGNPKRPIEFPYISYPVLPIESFSNGAKGVGSISMPSMQDGTVRFYQVLQELPVEADVPLHIANFPVYMVLDELGIPDSTVTVDDNKLKLGNDFFIPLNKDGTFRINWMGHEESIRYISFYKVLEERIPSEYFENKFVFFGTSASGLQDLKTVPCRAEKMPGVQVHAVAFLNMINQGFIREVTERAALPYFLGAALLLVSLFLLIRPFFGFFISLGMVLGEMFLFMLWYIPETSTVFPIVSLMLLTFIAYLTASLYIYFIRERKSRLLKTAFGSYVSPEVVDQIIKNSSRMQLGGEKKQLTVLFSDIRGFTSYSEGLDPQQIVAVLNLYLSLMSDIIFKHKGTIDKFIGDAIMAIFGAPVPQIDHADRACLVALGMIKELEVYNRENVQEGRQPLYIGVGVNTGDMTVGNIGSEKRFDYTVVGDSVNLGSRLEGLTKYFGVEIIISDMTRNACVTDQFIFRDLASVKVKGKDLPVRVFELLGLRADGPEPHWMPIWTQALNAFQRGNLVEAKPLFKQVLEKKPNDGPAILYLEKCNFYLTHSEIFDPLFTMDSK